jgi:hypothetical protein
MNISYAQIIITLVASLVSGMGTGLIAGRRSKKAEKIRAEEKLKDLQIKLYKLERDLDEWKDKYFEALQELIQVKAELENTLMALNHIEIHNLENNDEH